MQARAEEVHEGGEEGEADGCNLVAGDISFIVRFFVGFSICQTEQRYQQLSFSPYILYICIQYTSYIHPIYTSNSMYVSFQYDKLSIHPIYIHPNYIHPIPCTCCFSTTSCMWTTSATYGMICRCMLDFDIKVYV